MIDIAGVGVFVQDAEFTDIYLGPPIKINLLRGRPVSIRISIDESQLQHLVDVEKAIREFLALGESDRLVVEQAITEYRARYKAYYGGIDSVLKNAGDVWGHVKIDLIEAFVEDNQLTYVRMLADCDWDVEHGFQVVFESGSKLVRVGVRDGYVSMGDADHRYLSHTGIVDKFG